MYPTLAIFSEDSEYDYGLYNMTPIIRVSQKRTSIHAYNQIAKSPRQKDDHAQQIEIHQ